MKDLEKEGRILRENLRRAREALQEARAKKYPHLLPKPLIKATTKGK